MISVINLHFSEIEASVTKSSIFLTIPQPQNIESDSSTQFENYLLCYPPIL